MTNQVIPEAAVEAAHKAWREQAKQDGTIFEYNLRAAIEAAAQIVAAEAWDASAKATTDFELEYRDALHFCGELPDPPVNPYRPAE